MEQYYTWLDSEGAEDEDDVEYDVALGCNENARSSNPTLSSLTLITRVVVVSKK